MQGLNLLQSLKSVHARASLCKSFSEALLNEGSTSDCLTLSDEDALYACCNTHGTQAAAVVSRVDKIINLIIQKRATLMLKLVAGIKYHHVIKRDRQKHLAYMYRQRKSPLKQKRDRYKQWAKRFDTRAEAEIEVLDALERLRKTLRGDFLEMARK